MKIYFSFIKNICPYKISINYKYSLLSLLLFLFIVFYGCSHKTSTTTLPFSPPDAFSDNGVQSIPQKWWFVFADENLNTYIDSALKSNFNLKIAWKRLHASQAIVDRESANLWPALDASIGAELLGNQTNQNGDLSFNLGVTSTYEVDLWGRLGSAVEDERYRSEATYFDYQAAALTLSAEIARTWFQLSEVLNQLDLIEKQIETNQKLLTGIKNRFAIGQVRNVDILRQHQLLESTKEQKILAESRIELLRHKLAVLSGLPPKSSVGISKIRLPRVAEVPKAGIPSDLVQRRPDVQSAFHRLKAADMDLASAISNLYPRFTLSASYSSSSPDVNDLLQNWSYTIAGNLLTPVFYGGELRAEVDRNKSVRQQRFYEYVQVVLNAFREVEDALIQEKKQKQRIESIERQVKMSQQAYKQLQSGYFNGMSNYLDVLTALDEEQQLQRDLLSERLNLVEYRIFLYRSLAGGFEIERKNKR